MRVWLIWVLMALLLGTIGLVGVVLLAAEETEARPLRPKVGLEHEDPVQGGESEDADQPLARDEKALPETLESVRFEAELLPPAKTTTLAAARFGRPMVMLRGQLELRTAAGIDRNAGAKVLLRPTHGGQEVFEVSVVDGRFEGQAPRASSYEVVRIEAEGRALVALTERISNPERPQVVAAMDAPRVTLSVVAAEGDQPLAKIHWVRADRVLPSGATHPDALSSQAEVRDGSTHALVMERRLETHFFGAPGRAWQRVDFDAARAQDQVVRLHGSATLEIRCHGELDRAAQIRLAQPLASGEPGHTILTWPYSGPVARFTDLKEGPVLAVLEGPADSRGECEVLARAKVSLVIGMRAELDLYGRNDANLDGRVSLRGLVHVPAAYGELPPQVELSPVRTRVAQNKLRLSPAELKAVEHSKGSYHFDAGRVAPGQWMASVHGQLLNFEVLADRDNEIALRVDEPAELFVRVTCAEDGRAIEDAIVAVNRGAIGGVAANTYAPGARTSDPGTSSFLSAPGPVMVRVRAPGYKPATKPTELVPGQQSLTIALQSEQGLHLHLWGGLTEVPWPSGALPRLESINGPNIVQSTAVSGARITLHAPPGHYHLRFPKLAGYHPLADREVTLERGAMQTIRIELERALP